MLITTIDYRYSHKLEKRINDVKTIDMSFYLKQITTESRNFGLLDMVKFNTIHKILDFDRGSLRYDTWSQESDVYLIYKLVPSKVQIEIERIYPELLDTLSDIGGLVD